MVVRQVFALVLVGGTELGITKAPAKRWYLLVLLTTEQKKGGSVLWQQRPSTCARSSSYSNAMEGKRQGMLLISFQYGISQRMKELVNQPWSRRPRLYQPNQVPLMSG
jgi:hypothetical protein